MNINVDEFFYEEALNNMPSGQGLFEGIGDNFPNIGQAICEFLDDSISNLLKHKNEPNIKNKITLRLDNEDDGINITVSDGGTGIADLHNAFRVAGRQQQDTPLNEHGFGLKHALASCNSGSAQRWSLQTRTNADIEYNMYRMVSAPYAIGSNETNDKPMSVRFYEGRGDIPNITGTVVSVLCAHEKFQTIKPDGLKFKTDFKHLVEYLIETLRYTYSAILRDNDICIEVVYRDKKSTMKSQILTPLKPVWEPGSCHDVPDIHCDLGGGPVTIKMRYGLIYRSKSNYIYYKGNQRTSGAEIRLNGRVIQSGLLGRIWGEVSHNSHNRFLAQIDVISDSAGALPGTMNTKTAFCEGDSRFEKLLEQINTHIKAPTAEKGNLEHLMVLQLQEHKKAESGVFRCDLEEPVFRSTGANLPVDMYVVYDNHASVYEAKVGCSKPKDFAQLRQYVDGCSFDGKQCDEAVLIAACHSAAVEKLVEVYNQLTDPTGKPYHFRLTTWADEGIRKPIREV